MDRARFGVFTFTASTGDLRRGDVPVRLQAQPAKVLGALISRAGEVVSRDTLQREVWGGETHVDFERGLNFCIAQVRSALGDSAESPRFVETVPKQGYRFVAPVSWDAPPATVKDLPGTASPPPPGRAPRTTLAVAALAAVLVILAAIGWARSRTQPETVVVVPFYNETARAELDPLARALGDAVVAALAAPSRVERLSVIGNAPALRNPFARQDVQQVARDLDAEWLLIGQLKADGRGLRVIAHLIRAADMKHVWAQPFDDPAFGLDGQARTAESIAATVERHVSPR